MTMFIQPNIIVENKKEKEEVFKILDKLQPQTIDITMITIKEIKKNE